MDIDKLSDRDIMEMMIASFTMRRIAGEKFEDKEAQALERRMGEMMKKTLENLDSVSTLTTKLIDANDNLATERSSNRRLKKLLCDIAVVLWEDPSRYPKELGDVMIRVREEVGVKTS